MPGPYTYADVESLEGTDKIEPGECVALVKHYANAPMTGLWKEGDQVRGAKALSKGTAIATFVGGKYASAATGNHAALFISQNAAGIMIMDQWRKKATVSSRMLSFKGKDKDGKFKDPSNNGDAFSVIK